MGIRGVVKRGEVWRAGEARCGVERCGLEERSGEELERRGEERRDMSWESFKGFRYFSKMLLASKQAIFKNE